MDEVYLQWTILWMKVKVMDGRTRMDDCSDPLAFQGACRELPTRKPKEIRATSSAAG